MLKEIKINIVIDDEEFVCSGINLGTDEYYVSNLKLIRNEIEFVFKRLKLKYAINNNLGNITNWREDMDRIAEAIGMSKGANYGDMLGQIDELVRDAKKWRDLEDKMLDEDV